MQLDSTLLATAQPFQPRATLQSSREDDAPQTYPVRNGLAGSSPTPGFAADSPVGRVFPSHHQSSDDDGICPSPMGPPEGDVGAEEAKVARAVVTLMGPTPLGGDGRKRMDFQVKSRFLNLEARRAMLMMWPVPLGSGPTVSHTIVTTMRIPTSCPW